LKALAFHPGNCTGCSLCRLACSGQNEEIFNPRLARLKVTHRYTQNGLEVTGHTCNLCMTCVRVCPVEAIQETKGRLHFNLDSCTDCGLCVEACPQGVVVAKERGVGVCIQCRACVNWCPTEALTFEEVNR